MPSTSEASAAEARRITHADVDPASTALLVIDVQNDYIHADGALGLAGIDLSPCRTMVPRLEAFLEAARSQGLFLVFTRNWHRPTTDVGAWRERLERSGPIERRPGRAGSWGAGFYRVQPRDDEEIVSKTRYDAFLGTELDVILRGRGIATVLVAGVTTNVCVESTARSAHMRGYRVVLVADCCASDETELHAGTLTNIERHFGSVVLASEVATAWSRSA